MFQRLCPFLWTAGSFLPGRVPFLLAELMGKRVFYLIFKQPCGYTTLAFLCLLSFEASTQDC